MTLQTKPVGDPNSKYNYQFIHNVYADFFKSLLDWTTNQLYTRFKYKVISPYHKGVEYIVKTKELGHEVEQPTLPALILDPSGDFGISDLGGRQTFRFPNLSSGLVTRIYEPIYRDENVKIAPGFSRIKGEIILSSLTDSFYEYCDIRMLLLSVFGGLDRYIYPFWFESFIILPDEILNYKYTNSETGVSYKLNWEQAGAVDQLIRTIDQQKWVVKCNIKPMLKLTSINDGSEKYGGPEKIASWRSSATIEYEIEIPQFLVIESDWLATSFKLNVGSVSQYSKYGDAISDDISQTIYTRNTILDATSSDTISIDESMPVSEISSSIVLQDTFLYIFTATDFQVVDDLNIKLPEIVTDPDLIIAITKNGKLEYDRNMKLSDDGQYLILLDFKNNFASLSPNDVLEIYIYNRE